MIISSEHHDLLEEFQKANEIEAEAIKVLSEYATTPNMDTKIAMQLGREFEAAHENKMKIWKRLKEVRLDQ